MVQSHWDESPVELERGINEKKITHFNKMLLLTHLAINLTVFRVSVGTKVVSVLMHHKERTDICV